MPIKHIVISNNTNSIEMIVSQRMSIIGSNYPAHLQQENANHSNGYIETSASKLMANNSCANMFSGIVSLESIDMSSFDFRNTTNMYEMFSYCTNLHTITGIENFNVSNVSDFTRMFFKCNNLSYDLSNWKISNANTFLQTFAYAKLPSNMFEMNVRDASFSDTFTGATGTLTNFNNWSLTNCGSEGLLREMDNVCISNWNINGGYHHNFIQTAEKLEIKDSYMGNTSFQLGNTSNLKYINITNSSFKNSSLNFFGSLASNLINVDIYDSEMIGVRPYRNILYRCNNLHYINMYNCVIDNCNLISATGKNVNFLRGSNNLYGVSLIQCNFTDLKLPIHLFESQSNLQYFNMSGTILNSQSTYGMFNHLNNLISINMPNMSFASDVTTLALTFNYCSNLRSINVTNWNTQGISNFNCMFLHCESLVSLDLSGWNTRSVTNEYEMFYLDTCYSLTKVWVPIDVVGSSDNGNNPFQNYKYGGVCEVYLEGDLTSHNFSSIGSNWNIHYNASYEDFLGA